MNAKPTLLAIAIASGLAAAATDSTAVVHGANYDPVRHERMQTALKNGDTATVNSIRSEQRARMQALHGGKSGQGKGGMHGQGKGHGGGQCRGGQATTTTAP